MLRRITIQREIDEKRATEMKRQAKLHREMLEKQNKNLSKNKNIADMNITFDDKGAILKIKRPDPTKFNNIDTQKEIIESGIRDDLTEVVHSETVQRLKQMRIERAKTTMVKNNSVEMDEQGFTEDFIMMNQSGVEAMKTRGGAKKNLIAKTMTNVEDTHKSVQGVLPTYGVRMKNNIKG